MTNILLTSNVRELKENKNFTYILEDEEQFSQLGYKVMLSRKVNSILEAARIRRNGKVKLIYFTKDYQMCSMLLATMPFEGVMMLCMKIMDAVLQIKNQGFLACENIDIAVDHIFFDPKTYEAYLIYLPLVSDVENGEARFEVILRHTLTQIIKMSSAVTFEKEQMIVELLSDGNVGMEQLMTYLSQYNVHQPQVKEDGKAGLQLTSMNPEMPLVFMVGKKKFNIGRRKDNDGVLDFSTKISRDHCCIQYKDGAYYVEDVGSSLGTYLNKERLEPKQAQRLTNGDIIILPGIRFKAKFL